MQAAEHSLYAGSRPLTICRQQTAHCVQAADRSLYAGSRPLTICREQTAHCMQAVDRSLYAGIRPLTVCRHQTAHCMHVFRERSLPSPKLPSGIVAHPQYCQMTVTRYFSGTKSRHLPPSNAETKKASNFLRIHWWCVLLAQFSFCFALLNVCCVFIQVQQKRHFVTRLVNSSAHITEYLTNCPTKSVDQIHLENATFHPLVKIFPAFYVIRFLITVFT